MPGRYSVSNSERTITAAYCARLTATLSRFLLSRNEIPRGTSSTDDAVIEMKAPGPQGRYRILARYLAASPELDLGRVVRATDGATGADLRDLARRAYLASNGQVTTESVLRAVTAGRFSEDLTTGAYL